jgi:ComF family protein
MSFILDFLFPRRCYGCGRSGSYLCPQCSSKLIPHPLRPNFPPGFDGTVSLFRYRGPIKSAISDLKFHFVSDLIPEVASLMAANLKTDYSHLLEYWQQQKFVLIPVPLHPSRSCWRGFNQSELLASALSPLINIPYSTNVLIRTRQTSPQSLVKNKTLRRQNIAHSFILNSAISPPSKIILLDDVATTGATLTSALSVFSQNTESWALTLAG